MDMSIGQNRKFLLLTIYDICLSDRLFNKEHFSMFWTDQVKTMKDLQNRISWRKWSLISTLLMEIYSFCSRQNVSRLQVGNGKMVLTNGSGPLTVIVLLGEDEITVNSSYEKFDIITRSNYGHKSFIDLFKLDIKVETISLDDLTGFFDRDCNPDRWLILNLESSTEKMPRSSERISLISNYMIFEQQWRYLNIELLLNKKEIFPTSRSDKEIKQPENLIRTVHDQLVDKESDDLTSGFIMRASVFRTFLDLFNKRSV